MNKFPEVGRWICLTIGDRDFIYKVLKYENTESREWTAWSGFKVEMEKNAIVRSDGGDEDSLDEYTLKNYKWKWKYIEEPAQNDLTRAEKERKNNLLGYKCNYCEGIDKDLLKCSRCKEVRYCNRDCQEKDWQNHQMECKRIKMVLKPNPRYPLLRVNEKIAFTQKAKQDKLNKILKNSFTGKFKVNINGDWKTNPKSSDLQSGERYCLYTLANKDHPYHFKQRHLEHSNHSSSPTSCGLYMLMEIVFDKDDFKDGGGLHHLVDYSMDPGLFWGMALNFNTFGTVAPFDPNCHCKFPKMPLNYKKLKKQWDKIFFRAKEDINDIQCMFADTEEGCHSFGLPGQLGCKFKHDIQVEKEEESEDPVELVDVENFEIEEKRDVDEKNNGEEKKPVWQKKQTKKKKKHF